MICVIDISAETDPSEWSEDQLRADCETRGEDYDASAARLKYLIDRQVAEHDIRERRRTARQN